jgi:hypothetical protein
MSSVWPFSFSMTTKRFIVPTCDVRHYDKRIASRYMPCTPGTHLGQVVFGSVQPQILSVTLLGGFKLGHDAWRVAIAL